MSDFNTKINDLNNSLNVTELMVSSQIQQVTNWQNKFRNIMLLGKELPVIPEELKTDEALVQGCESKVWLHISWQQTY